MGCMSSAELEIKPPIYDPRVYDHFQKFILQSIDNGKNYNDVDNFEIWTRESVEMELFTLNHFYQFEQSNPAFPKILQRMRNYIAWFEKTKPPYTGKDKIAQIRWICNHARGTQPLHTPLK
jgi:hypothetical protein